MPCMSSVRSTQSAIALDARVMARNVCRDLVFEANSHTACSHSDLGGCADGTAEALPARQTASIRCWHAPMQLSGLPRVFVHALAFSSTPSHADAAEFSSTPSHAAAAAHDLCSFHHLPRVRQLSDSRCSAARRGSTAPGYHPRSASVCHNPLPSFLPLTMAHRSKKSQSAETPCTLLGHVFHFSNIAKNYLFGFIC